MTSTTSAAEKSSIENHWSAKLTMFVPDFNSESESDSELDCQKLKELRKEVVVEVHYESQEVDMNEEADRRVKDLEEIVEDLQR